MGFCWEEIFILVNENYMQDIIGLSYLPTDTSCTCAYQGVRNVHFYGKFGVLCFYETPILRFALLPYYRRIDMHEVFSSSIWIMNKNWI